MFRNINISSFVSNKDLSYNRYFVPLNKIVDVNNIPFDIRDKLERHFLEWEKRQQFLEKEWTKTLEESYKSTDIALNRLEDQVQVKNDKIKGLEEEIEAKDEEIDQNKVEIASLKDAYEEERRKARQNKDFLRDVTQQERYQRLKAITANRAYTNAVKRYKKKIDDLQNEYEEKELKNFAEKQAPNPDFAVKSIEVNLENEKLKKKIAKMQKTQEELKKKSTDNEEKYSKLRMKLVRRGFSTDFIDC